MKSWNWIAQYAVAILLALLLGTLLASFPVFKESVLGATPLKASDVVRFLGYGGALLLFWLAGRRATLQLEEEAGKSSTLSYVITPLITLIGLSVGYEILLQLLEPFLGKTGKNIYNWVFVVGIVSTALWLTLAWLRHSEPLLVSMQALGHRGHDVPSQQLVTCPQCNTASPADANFCVRCGVRLWRNRS